MPKIIKVHEIKILIMSNFHLYYLSSHPISLRPHNRAKFPKVGHIRLHRRSCINLSRDPAKIRIRKRTRLRGLFSRMDSRLCRRIHAKIRKFRFWSRNPCLVLRSGRFSPNQKPRRCSVRAQFSRGREKSTQKGGGHSSGWRLRGGGGDTFLVKHTDTVRISRISWQCGDQHGQ